MICPYCGKENPEDQSRCGYCGGNILETNDQSTVESLLPEPASQPELSPLETGHSADQLSAPPPETPVEQGEVLDQNVTPFPLDEDALPQAPARRSKAGCERYIWWLVGGFVLLCLALSCAALLYGFYNYSPVLDFAKPATPTPSMLFSDDFSDPDSGWPSYTEADYIDDYYHGAYRMVENIENTTSWVYPGEYSFSDVSVAVDATKNGGPDENDMGVICRFQDDDHFYFGLITSDGYYGIIKMTDGEFSVLGSEYLEASDYVKQGSATNHIRLDCVGERLTMFVNGEQLTQQTDGDYRQGNIGLIIGTYETPGTDILFDNFTVYKP